MKTESTLLIEMGSRLRQQRQQMQLTQEALSKMSGLSIKTIISAEKGEKARRPENIVRLCQSLNMDISYLMTGHTSRFEAISSLDSQERMALDKIIEAFLSICAHGKEP